MNPDVAERALEDNMQSLADGLSTRDLKMYLPEQLDDIWDSQGLAVGRLGSEAQAQQDLAAGERGEKGDTPRISAVDVESVLLERFGRELGVLPGVDAPPWREWPKAAEIALEVAGKRLATELCVFTLPVQSAFPYFQLELSTHVVQSANTPLFECGHDWCSHAPERTCVSPNRATGG